jgi:hypothetical protein
VLNSVLLTAAQKMQNTDFFDDPEFHRDNICEAVMDVLTTTCADMHEYRQRVIYSMNAIKELADLCIVLEEDIKACKGV